MKRRFKSLVLKLIGNIIVGVVGWALGLVASVGIAYFFTDIKDYQELAKKARTVIMRELQKNKKEVVETVQVLVKEYRAQDPEAVKRFLFNNKDFTIKIINESFPEYENDVKDILINISPEAKQKTKKIMDEIMGEIIINETKQ